MKTKLAGVLRAVCAVTLASVAGAALAAYTITTYSYPGALGTQAWAINNSLQVAGNANLGPGVTDGVGFVYSFGPGTFTVLPATGPGSLAIPLGINDAGIIVGGVSTVGSDFSSGFVLNAGTYSLFNYPGAPSTVARAITPSGMVSGYFEDVGGNLSGFSYQRSTVVFTPVTIPGSAFTLAQGINSSGVIVGSALLPPGAAYSGSPSGQYGFVRQPGGAVTLFRVNGRATRARGINDAGMLVGWLNDVTPGENRSFVIAAPTGTGFVPVTVAVVDYLAVPGRPQTFAEGINNLGFISGSSGDGVGGSIAFVAAPPAATLIADLGAMINGFGLPAGLNTALGAKVDAAQAALAAGNVTAARNNLQALINLTNAQSGKKLTAAQANQIITAANAIRTTLDATPPPVTTSPPTVTINQAIGQADPSNSSPINFTVTFSKAVTGFTAADVATAGSTATIGLITITGTNPYNVAINATGSGTVVASIVVNAAQDAAGNNSLASTSTDNTVTLDATPPTVTINQAIGQADPANSSPINFTVIFSEPVTGFTAADVATTGSTATIGAITVTGTNPYNVAINATGSGTVVASIVLNAALDAAGNNSLASTSTDNTVTLTPAAPTSRVFVSSTDYDANFGGHAGADAECQNHATHAALGGTWKAWISDSTSSPAARFTQSTGPYRRLDGALIAANWADLTDGALVNAISIDEYGNGAGFSEVWTATNPDGTYSGGSCSDFTSIDSANTSYPLEGSTSATSSAWTAIYYQECNRVARFYCFEQTGAAIAPVAAADTYSAKAGVMLAVGATPTGLLANDTPGVPPATVTSYGGGSLGGTVIDHGAGTSTPSLTVNADGSFNFASFAVGTFTFNYRLGPASGTSDALVTITNAAQDIVFVGGSNTTQYGNVAGGSAFDDACPAGQALIGFTGELQITGGLSSIGARCGSVSLDNGGIVRVAPGITFPVRGTTTAIGPWTVSCPADQLIVGFAGRSGLSVEALVLRCAPISAAIGVGGVTFSIGTPSNQPQVGGLGGSPFPQTDCPNGQVANVSRVRAGGAVDAFGLTCSGPTGS